jgi:hypothetical protein
MIPCKHLVYNVQEPEWISAQDAEGVKYWIIQNHIPEEEPKAVQFCKNKGMINGIYQCYMKSGMECYDACY